jgi:hypothetical protein
MIVVYSEVESIQVIIKRVDLGQISVCGIRKPFRQLKSWTNKDKFQEIQSRAGFTACPAICFVKKST